MELNLIMLPTASIVIPTFNGASRKLSECLFALMQQKAKASVEIIVVDDGSTDQTPHLISQWKDIRVFRQQRLGPAVARNLGLHQATGDIVLFIDDDCIPESNWLEAMLEPFSDADVDGVKGCYLSDQLELVAQFVQLEYEEKYDRLSILDRIDLIDTYSAAFRREVLVKAGGFAASFPVPSVEDRELSWRLAQEGRRLVFQPQAKVWHTHPQTLSQYFWKKFKNGYWGHHLIRTHPRLLRGTSDTPGSQKLQLCLIGFIPVLFFHDAWKKRWSIEIYGLGMFLFFLSCGSLGVKAWKKQRSLALLLPVFLLIRACALGLGLAAGGFRGTSSKAG